MDFYCSVTDFSVTNPENSCSVRTENVQKELGLMELLKMEHVHLYDNKRRISYCNYENIFTRVIRTL